MRTNARIFFIFLTMSVWLAGSAGAATEEENQKLLQEMKNYQFKDVTTKEGLHFRIPEDMPIETRNSVVAPIPFDEYMYFKLRKLDEKLDLIGKKINDLQTEFKSMDQNESKKINDLQAEFKSFKQKELERTRLGQETVAPPASS